MAEPISCQCIISIPLEKSDFRGYRNNVDWVNIPAGIYLFKVTNRNIRIMCEICSKLKIKKLTS